MKRRRPRCARRIPGPPPGRPAGRRPGAPGGPARWWPLPAAAALAALAGLTACGPAHGPGPQPGAAATRTAPASTAPASTAPASTAPASTARGSTAPRAPARTSTGQPAPVPNDAASGDSPGGFWYGTDSWPVPLAGGAPWREPVNGGLPGYGGYIGMAGSWARWLGCGGLGANIAWSAADAAAALTNYRTYHQGIGIGVYWFMAGPGVDPHYNGTTAQARAWGAAQAAVTLQDMAALHVTSPVVWMDVELPGVGPALDNGWDSVYSSPCSGRVSGPHPAPAVDRAVLTGYQAYFTAHSSYRAGVYSAPPVWGQIFGTGPAAAIPGLDEWTYTDGTRTISPAPRGWCIPGTSTCARFFGGITATSPHAAMWQWSGGGGLTNGVGDFDQIRVAALR